MNRKNNITLRVLAAFISIIFAAQAASFIGEGATIEIRVAITSNINGRILEAGSWPGFSKIYTAMNQYEPDIMLDFGGFFSGSVFSDASNGELAAEISSVAQYDARALSPRDWAFGKEQLLLLERASQTPILALNVFDKATGEPFFAAKSITKMVKGQKIGIYGVIGEDMRQITPNGYLDGIVYRDPIALARLECESLRGIGCKTVILLAQTRDKKIAQSLSELADIVVLPPEASIQASNVAIVGELSSCVSFVTINPGGQDNIGRSSAYQIPSKKESKIISDKLQALMPAYTRSLEAKIGDAKEEIKSFASNEGGDEATIGNLVCDAYRFATNADIAFESGMAIGEPIPAGPILKRMVEKAIPSSGHIATAKLTGLEILDILEQSSQIAVQHKPDSTGAKPSHMSLQVSGIKYSYDPALQMGKRVYDAFIGNEPLQLKKDYTVAFSSFTGQLEDYPILHRAERLTEGESAFKSVCRFIENGWFSASITTQRIFEAPLPKNYQKPGNSGQTAQTPPKSETGDPSETIETKPGEGDTGEAHPSEGGPNEGGGSPNEGAPGEGSPGDGKPGEGSPNEGIGGPGEGVPGDGKPDDGETSETNPYGGGISPRDGSGETGEAGPGTGESQPGGVTPGDTMQNGSEGNLVETGPKAGGSTGRATPANGDGSSSEIASGDGSSSEIALGNGSLVESPGASAGGSETNPSANAVALAGKAIGENAMGKNAAGSDIASAAANNAYERLGYNSEGDYIGFSGETEQRQIRIVNMGPNPKTSGDLNESSRYFGIMISIFFTAIGITILKSMQED